MKTETHQQFDFFSGRFEAMKGMGLAEDAQWSANASAWLEEKPVGYQFSADDLRKACGVVATGVNKNNGPGGWFSAMAKEGRIAFTGRCRNSSVVSRHASLQRIWRKVR
jgi:hypothetical protein